MVKFPKLDLNTENWQIGAVITGSGQVIALNTQFPEFATYLFNAHPTSVALVTWKNTVSGKTGTLPLAPLAQPVAVACDQIVSLVGELLITDIYWGTTANRIIPNVPKPN
jgi:hypothetical protein